MSLFVRCVSHTQTHWNNFIEQPSILLFTSPLSQPLHPHLRVHYHYYTEQWNGSREWNGVAFNVQTSYWTLKLRDTHTWDNNISFIELLGWFIEMSAYEDLGTKEQEVVAVAMLSCKAAKSIFSIDSNVCDIRQPGS